jgi:DNA polymerase alpha subunit A
LEELAKKMRNNELPLEKYTITKGLSKHPNDYPDGKSQAHVQVAKMMLKNNRPVNTGDHIPYIITAQLENSGAESTGKAPSPAERARHPEEIARSNGVLKPDVEYYLAQQILPPVARLCEPIQETSQRLLAEKMGLDSTKYSNHVGSGELKEDDDEVNYTPASMKSDEERFAGVEKFMMLCTACNVSSEFPGVFHVIKSAEGDHCVEGLRCVNPDCPRPQFWGQKNYFECFSRISNSMAVWVYNLQRKYYQGIIRCDEPMCGLETRQLSVHGGVCLRRGCNGKMLSICTEKVIHTHLKYLETLFDREHAARQLEEKKKMGRKEDLLKDLPPQGRKTFDELHLRSKHYLSMTSFNFISPGFWKSMTMCGATQ